MQNSQRSFINVRFSYWWIFACGVRERTIEIVIDYSSNFKYDFIHNSNLGHIHKGYPAKIDIFRHQSPMQLNTSLPLSYRPFCWNLENIFFTLEYQIKGGGANFITEMECWYSSFLSRRIMIHPYDHFYTLAFHSHPNKSFRPEPIRPSGTYLVPLVPFIWYSIVLF